MVKGSPYKPNPFRYTTAALLSAVKTAQESNLVRQVLAGIPQASAKALDDLAQQNKRSEEHTSELQSQSNLVCRLLLENKNLTPSLSTPHWLDALTPPLEGHLDRLQNSIKALLQLEKRESAATPTPAATEKPVPPLTPV